MADNAIRKPAHKHASSPADHNASPAATVHPGQMPARKISAPVHRTTTETIRISEPIDNFGKGQHHHHHHGQSLGSIPMTTASSTSNNPNTGAAIAQNRTKKTSSFQITSVTVGCRMSNDAGEDSNDDLDESHTEDNSVEHSRITDIETPSYSEDTFSKDDVFFNASNAALSTAPVIPTSSQYGLAIVPSSEANITSNSTNENNINTLDIASVTDNNIINLLSSSTKQDADLREVHSHGRNERFKVVKIESTEPFKRGRWTCMDYLDHTSVNQSTTTKVPDPNEVCISYGVTDAGIVVPEIVNKVVDDMAGMSIDANGPMHPEVQQQQQQQQQQQHAGTQSLGAASAAGYAPVPTQQQPQQVPPQYYQASATQAQQQQTQGTTLPANLQSAHPNSMAQTQSMPQGTIPILTQQTCPATQTNNMPTQQQTITHPQTDETTTYVPVNSQAQSMGPPPQAQNVCQQPTSVAPSQPPPNILVPQSQQQSQQAPPPTSQPQATQQQQIPEQMQAAMQNMQSLQGIHKVPQSSGPPPPQQQQQPQQSQQLQPQVMSTNAQMQSTQQQQQPQTQQQQTATGTSAQVQMVGGMQQGNISFHQQQQQPVESDQDSMANMMVAGALAAAATDAALLESLAEVTQNADDHQAHDDNESMSGTSAVAIDNKIEQAMDLVKSHLMFAVREEVEVLKEKIAELMDRINQLEAENSILKAHATPETLAQLSQSAAAAAAAATAATTKLPTINNSGGGQ